MSAEIAVVIAARDAARFLAEALASLPPHPQLAEIVVVDDGSTDETGVVARRDPRVRCVLQEARGAAAARNRGIAASRAPVLGFLDADDRWAIPPAEQDPRAAILAAHPDLPFVGGRTRYWRRRPDGREELGDPRELLAFGAFLVRRSIFERVGAIEESLTCGEDLDWFFRAKRTGFVPTFCDETTLHYRRHGGSLTAQRQPREHFLVIAVRRALERRRRLDPS